MSVRVKGDIDDEDLLEQLAEIVRELEEAPFVFDDEDELPIPSTSRRETMAAAFNNAALVVK